MEVGGGSARSADFDWGTVDGEGRESTNDCILENKESFENVRTRMCDYLYSGLSSDEKREDEVKKNEEVVEVSKMIFSSNNFDFSEASNHGDSKGRREEGRGEGRRGEIERLDKTVCIFIRFNDSGKFASLRDRLNQISLDDDEEEKKSGKVSILSLDKLLSSLSSLT